MITAHTGCDGTMVNSMETVEYALKTAADAFEVDVRRNAAGELILSHDETDEDVTTLKEVFALLAKNPEKKINCDLKELNIEGYVVELAREMGVEEQLIFTGDVNRELFKKGQVVYPKVTWFANMSAFCFGLEERVQQMTEEEGKEALVNVLRDVLDYEAAGVNWHYSTAERVWEEAAQLGVGISVWTVDEETLQEKWLERNVANITSCNITALSKARERRG